MRFLIKIIHILFFAVLFITKSAVATHIVGGALTYVHNGGNNYTITCKLYRDCSPNTFAMPNNLPITVRGLNGASFNPSRDITIPRIQTIPVPPSLDSCAIRPNPEPCVEEGLFQITVDLPPSPGGYHLYINTRSRNLSLTNINSSGNDIGETFYCFIPAPTTVWTENFTLANGTTVDNGATAWSIANGATAPSSAAVNGNQFQVAGANSASVWFQTQSINISSATPFGGADLSVNLGESGSLESGDSIKIFYSVDGGALIPFSNNGTIGDDFGNTVAFTSGVVGTNVVIYVKVVFDGNSPNTEIYSLDDVSVFYKNLPNSDPTFNLFPPLYLCVGQKFEFDHSATDIDSDSLVYSFYTPYNGYAGTSTPVAPTYNNNYPSFTPIVYLNGYSQNDPLGASGMSLNSQTGFLSGLPTQTGQYVVGIKVTEYRDGVWVSETIRDFQFNVINCPPTNKAMLEPFVACAGTTVKFTTASDTTQTTTWWDFGNPNSTSDTSIKHAPSYTYPSVGTYYVTLYTNKGTVCEDTAIAPVYVGWAGADFVKSTEQCIGYPISFTDSSVVSGNAVISSYSWDFGDGTSSTLANPSHTYNVAGTYTIIQTITSDIGCTDTAMATVNIGPAPTVNAGANQTVCSLSPAVTLNGSVTNATGGVWSSSGTGTFTSTTNLTGVTYNPSAADVAAGSVNVMLSSVSNSVCVITDTVKVTIVNSPTVSNAGTDQIICGTNSTILSANVPTVGSGVWTNSNAGITIVNPTSPTTQVTGFTAGNSYNFTWTITNGAACASRDIVTISVDNLPTTATAGSDQLLCNLNTTVLDGNTPAVGTGVWTVVDGSGTFSASSNPNSNLNNLVLGDTVTVRWTISQGVCKSFDDVKIIVDKLPVVNAGTNQALCNQNTIVQLNGTVNNATGGIWSGGSGTFNPGNQTLNATYIPTAAELSAGSVNLTLTSTGNGACNAVTDQVLVTFVPFNGTVTVNTTPTACLGDANGVLAAVVNGTSNYTYTWNTVPAQYNDSASGLSAGNYQVIIVDALGCSASANGTVSSPTALSATISGTNVDCNANATGSATVLPTGGNGGYNYSWVPNVGNTANVNNLIAGNYTVYVTDAKSCQISRNVTINQPQPLLLSSTVTPVSCNGGSNGQMNVTISGGTIPYTYSWNTVNGNGAAATGLQDGIYSLLVTDANSCSASITDTIVEPDVLNAVVTVADVDCNGSATGSATASVTGGTAPYSYAWGPGVASTTAQANNLEAGNYFVLVTDSKQCTFQTSLIINEPAVLNASIASFTNVSCNNGSDASISISVNGGTGAYTYVWTPNVSTTSNASNLPAGTYTIQIKDQNNCTTQLTQIISQPAVFAATESHTDPTCNGYNNGSINVSATGGVTPYSYSWSVPGIGNVSSFNQLPSGAYTIIVSDSNGCNQQLAIALVQPSDIVLSTSSISSTCGSNNGSATVLVSGGTGAFTYSWVSLPNTTNTVSNLLAGPYLVFVFDASLCYDSTYVLINDVAGPTISISSITDASCFGGSDGSATVSVSAGTAPFTYSWSSDPSQNTATVTGLTAGVYVVEVSDSNGCKTMAITTPPIGQPDSLTYDARVIDAGCYNSASGSLYVYPSGGTSPYTVSWINPVITSDSVFNLAAGVYQFTIEDDNGCTKSGQLTVNQPDVLNVTLQNSTDISCLNANDGSATVIVSGGTQPYIYSWNNSNSVGNSSGNLIPGNHQVIVSDLNLCKDTVTFSLSQPADSITAVLTITDVSCSLGSNGGGSIVAAGGNGSYTYTWLPSGTNGTSISNLSAGNYSVLVNDVKGCSELFTFEIDQPELLSSNTLVNSSTCGYSNGSIIASAIGGNGLYTYTWNPGNIISSSITNIGAGIYYLTIADSLNCTFADTIQLNNISGPEISDTSITNVSCFGLTNGSIIINAVGGTGPLTYSWLPSVGNDSILNNLSQGTYTGFVKDFYGCIDSVVINLTQPSVLNIDSIIVSDILCNGQINGEAQVVVTGGTPIYTYSWCGGVANNQNVTNLPVGSCFVSVTDVNNCTASSSFTVNQPALLEVNATSIVNATCTEYSDGSLSITVSGGNLPYAYSWSHDADLNTGYANNLGAGSYSVTVTDAKGCFDTLTVEVQEPSNVLVAIANDPVVCLGQTTTLTALATGGNGGPYTYEWQPTPGNGNSLTITPQQTQNYFVFAYDNKGCISAAEQALITVYSLFAGDVDLIMKNPICKGTSTTLQAISNGANTGPLTYTWNQGLGNSPGPITVTPNAPTVYSVTVSTSCGTSVIVRDTLKFIDPPVADFSGDTTKGCYPLPVSFVDSSLQNPSDSIVAWLWSFGDGNTSTEQNPNYVYNTPGQFNVTLNIITQEGCNITTAASAYQVIVYDHPDADFTASPQPVFIPLGVVNFQNNSTAATTYTWDFGDGVITTTKNTQYEYQNVGEFDAMLIAIDNRGCRDTMIKSIIVSGDIVMPNAFTPNPEGSNGGAFNPASLDNDVYSAYVKGTKDFKMHIFNRWGELIFESTDPTIGWDGYYKGRICEAGVYIWQVYIMFNDGREFKKVGDLNLIR